MKPISQILTEALELLKSVEWYHGKLMPFRCECAYTAIAAKTIHAGPAAKVFQEANGIVDDDNLYGIPAWNDAPGRTVEEVYAAFDKAIEAAKQEEGKL